ncbi:hypothetical protein IKI14_06065 [bacterium]|nr:hypothetical protein [bacterium]
MTQRLDLKDGLCGDSHDCSVEIPSLSDGTYQVNVSLIDADSLVVLKEDSRVFHLSKPEITIKKPDLNHVYDGWSHDVVNAEW